MANEPESKDEKTSECEAFKVFSESMGTKYSVYLPDGVADESFDYTDLIHLLTNTVETGDRVHIHIANFGGSCHSGIRLAHAIKRCRGDVLMDVEGPCYSMGAILALTGDALVMQPKTFLMFHNYSTVEVGKGGEVSLAVNEFHKHFFGSLEYFCCPFLTQDEINKLKKDEDCYVHQKKVGWSDKDLKARIKRHFKYMDLRK